MLRSSLSPQFYYRWFRLLISGTLNTGIDFAVFAALVHWSELSLFRANLIAFAAALACSFLLHRFWMFKERRTGSGVVFGLWMSLIAILASWLLAQVVLIGVPLAIAKICVTFLVALLSYQLMSRFVFTTHQTRKPMAGGFALLVVASSITSLAPAKERSALPDDLAALYPAAPQAPVSEPMHVYHLGHSLVGRDMPSMLAQLAGADHSYGFQLGWGTTLKAHLQGPEEILGFAEENASAHFVPLPEALASRDFDALVFTEMIGLDAAIRYHDTSKAVIDLTREALTANPDLDLFLYETWHPLDDGDWLSRIPQDWERQWQPFLLVPALRTAKAPIRVIPAGTALARLAHKAETTPGGLGGMHDRSDLFSDLIHLNDLGAYMVALTHYAVLYRRSPVGLPHELKRADGTSAQAPSAELAAVMQKTAWETVQSSRLSW